MTPLDDDWSASATWHGMPVGRRVLVAEDDAAMREIIATVLGERGYQITLARSGSELSRLLSESNQVRPFDLIVTDVQMPGISGLDVIDQIRKLGNTTPVVIVTAFPQDDVRKRARGLEVRLLAKPFELETLRSAVDWAILANAPHARRLDWSQ